MQDAEYLDNKKEFTESKPGQSSVRVASEFGQSSETLAERLRHLKGQSSVNAFAKACGIEESLMRKYFSGSTPGLDKALRIAQAMRVNLGWLATGAEPMRPGGQISDKSGLYGLQPVLDMDRLTEAIDIVNTVAAAKDAAWKARMAVAIYDLGDVPRAKKEVVVRAAL